LQIAKILNVSAEELLGEKSQREYHQHNFNKGNVIGHQECVSYYQENKETTQKLINRLESTISHLEEEVAFLRSRFGAGS